MMQEEADSYSRDKKGRGNRIHTKKSRIREESDNKYNNHEIYKQRYLILEKFTHS